MWKKIKNVEEEKEMEDEKMEVVCYVVSYT